MPGYLLSPDLVVRDASGFVPLLYRQPVPFLASLFGLFRVPDYLGSEVVATGWYRRLPGPAVELRRVTRVADGRSSRTWEWVARYAASMLLAAAGVIVMLVGLGR